MKIKNQQNFWAGLVFLVFGIVFAAGASNHPMGSHQVPGPGYFPLLLSALLALLGALILFFSLTFETEGGNPIGPLGWRPLLAVVSAIVGFTAALPWTGLVLACPLLAVLAALAGPVDGRRLLLGTLVVSALSWLVLVLGWRPAIALWPGMAA